MESNLNVPMGRGPAGDGGKPDRARPFYLARRRQDLLAPTHALIEMVDLLSAEEKIGACGPILADLQKIKVHAQRMAAMIQSALDPARSVDEASKTLNHDLSNCLTPILGYGGDLARVASKYFLESFANEFREVDGLGHQVQYLAQATVEQLRSPEAHAFAEDVSHYLERIPAPGAGDDEGLSRAAERGRILVAEDSEPVRDLLCEYLRSQGHDVVPARDGAEALERLNAVDLDLVMTDIEMPRADGFEVIERLRSNPRWRNIPVIVISGHSRLDGIAHCIKMGAEDYLPKPFNRVILKARVDACLEKKRLRDVSEQERLRYNDLLNAILPGPVVKELVETDAVKPRRREGVAVLFADIVGFTSYCDDHSDCPEFVVQHLRRLFEAWEKEASALGVQKIKTIGDAFMAASGLLEDVPNPVIDCVQLGMRMIEFTQRLCDGAGLELGFELRVGVHVGTVVSGVLGRRQSLFDLWGDTVNLAARLESHGDAGCVNLSVEAWERVRGSLTGERHSFRELKGKPGLTKVIHLHPGAIRWLENRAGEGLGGSLVR
jgi:class 3 adenylate cyclase/CheY-like chemotaxis protein